jgi:hypothetical protein
LDGAGLDASSGIEGEITSENEEDYYTWCQKGIRQPMEVRYVLAYRASVPTSQIKIQR